MAKMSNKQILDQIRATGSAEYQERVPEAMGVGGNVSKVFTQYPTMKNEFINTLTNKVIKTYFYSKVFNNPLRLLHKGNLEYGYSLEQLFVDMAEKKGFFENFDNGDEIKDLVATKKPSVKQLYIERNFAYKYKVTISDAQLKTAFRSQEGLYDLVERVTSSLISGAYFDEFKDMKAIINAHAQGKFLAYDTATGKAVETDLTSSILPNGKTASLFVVGEHTTKEAQSKAISEAVRGLTGRLKFPSTKYNSAGVNQWNNPDELIFLTTPELNAQLDVNVLADAFNVSKADLNVRVLDLDELPQSVAVGKDAVSANKTFGYVHQGTLGTSASKTADVKVLGVLMDTDFLQAYDTLLETRSFENANNLSTNMFLHKQGIMSTCYFGNCIFLVESIPQVS